MAAIKEICDFEPVAGVQPLFSKNKNKEHLKVKDLPSCWAWLLGLVQMLSEVRVFSVSF